MIAKKSKPLGPNHSTEIDDQSILRLLKFLVGTMFFYAAGSVLAFWLILHGNLTAFILATCSMLTVGQVTTHVMGMWLRLVSPVDAWWICSTGIHLASVALCIACWLFNLLPIASTFSCIVGVFALLFALQAASVERLKRRWGGRVSSGADGPAER